MSDAPTNGQNGAQQNGKKSKVMGRPTKRTDEIIERIKGALAVGLDWRTAARCAQVPERTLRLWREQDPELSATLEGVKAEAVRSVAVELLKLIAEGEFAAIKFFLTTHAEEFKESKGPEVAVQINQAIEAGGLRLPDGSTREEYFKTLAAVVKDQGLLGEDEDE